MANNRINNKVAYEFYNKFEKFDLAVLIFVNIIIDILLFLGYCADQGLLEHGVVNNINIVESVICMLYYVYIFCIYLLFWKHRNVNDDGEKFENKSSKLYFHFQGIFSVILFLTTTVFVCYAAIRGLRDHFHVFEKGYDIWICWSYVYIKICLFITVINHIYIRPRKNTSKKTDGEW